MKKLIARLAQLEWVEKVITNVWSKSEHLNVCSRRRVGVERGK